MRTLILATCCSLLLASSADNVDIPLAVNLRLILRPTLLGLVPPADPRGYGECLVRIRSLDGDRLVVRYELKEEAYWDTQAERFHEWWEPPGDEFEARTRIRRGDIQVNGMGTAPSYICPLFWDDGDFATESSLLWLSESVFRALKADAVGNIALLTSGELPVVLEQELERYLAERYGAQVVENSGAVELHVVDAEAAYPCLVNGERASLPALRVRDSLALAEYWVLDNEHNPLILKLTYLPVPDKLPNVEVQTTERVDREENSDVLELYRSKSELDENINLVEELDTDSIAELISAGGGYAITQINF